MRSKEPFHLVAVAECVELEAGNLKAWRLIHRTEMTSRFDDSVGTFTTKPNID
jgi:hypothetical protein